MKVLVFVIAYTIFIYLLGGFAVWDLSWPTQMGELKAAERMALLFGYVGLGVAAIAILDTV